MKDLTTRKQRLAKQNFMAKELKELFAKTPEFIKDTAVVITGVVIAWGFAVVIMSF